MALRSMLRSLYMCFSCALISAVVPQTPYDDLQLTVYDDPFSYGFVTYFSETVRCFKLRYERIYDAVFAMWLPSAWQVGVYT